MMYDDSYTAASITILAAEAAERRFVFVKVADLAARYPSVASSFIERLLESCRLSGFNIELAVRAYLAKDMAAFKEGSSVDWETLRTVHQQLSQAVHHHRSSSTAVSK